MHNQYKQQIMPLTSNELSALERKYQKNQIVSAHKTFYKGKQFTVIEFARGRYAE